MSKYRGIDLSYQQFQQSFQQFILWNPGGWLLNRLKTQNLSKLVGNKWYDFAGGRLSAPQKVGRASGSK